MQSFATLKRMFPALSDEDLLSLQEKASIMKIRKGQNLFIAGNIATSVYGVISGCFKIARENRDGDSIITRIVQTGEIIGIREIVGEIKYSRTCVALKETQVLAVEKEHILSLIQKNAAISFQFMKMFSYELTKIETRVEARLHYSAKSRVVSTLLELYQLFSNSSDSKVFNAPLSRSDIAELSDVTPETVSRCLADLKLSGVLKASGSTFTVLNFNSLQNEAEER